MKVVCIFLGSNICIDNRYSGALTLGKVYDTDFTYDDAYGKASSMETVIVINDIGNRCKYPSNLFDTLANIRNNKLIEMGI